MSLRRVAAVLLVVTAALFAVGVAAEGDEDHHDEASEHFEHTEAGERSEEEVLGIDAESPGLVAVGVLVSLVLAVGLWRRGSRGVAVATVIVATGFAVFDVAELIHQLDEDRAGIAVLAAVIAAGHLATAGLAGRTARGAP